MLSCGRSLWWLFSLSWEFGLIILHIIVMDKFACYLCYCNCSNTLIIILGPNGFVVVLWGNCSLWWEMLVTLMATFWLQIHPGALSHGGKPLVACCLAAAKNASVCLFQLLQTLGLNGIICWPVWAFMWMLITMWALVINSNYRETNWWYIN